MVIDGINIILVAAVVVVAIIAVVVAILMRNKKRAFSKEYFGVKSRSKTDLDILYEILKKEKMVSVDDIERTFKVDADVALGWAKILENADLAIIDYPRFGKPVLNIVDSALKEGELKKKDIVVENTVKEVIEVKKGSPNAEKDIEKKKAYEEKRMKDVARLLEKKKAYEEKRMKERKIIEEKKNKKIEEKKFKKEVLAKKLAEEKRIKEEVSAKKSTEGKRAEEVSVEGSPGIFKRIKGFFSRGGESSNESHVVAPLAVKKIFTKLPVVVGENKKDAARIIQEELDRLDHEEKMGSRK